MTERADTRVDTYSRGMLQRLGIADALVKSRRSSSSTSRRRRSTRSASSRSSTCSAPRPTSEASRSCCRATCSPGPVGLRPGRHLRRRASSSASGRVAELAEPVRRGSPRTSRSASRASTTPAGTSHRVCSVRSTASRQVRQPARASATRSCSSTADEDCRSGSRGGPRRPRPRTGSRLSSIRAVVPSLDDIYRTRAARAADRWHMREVPRHDRELAPDGARARAASGAKSRADGRAPGSAPAGSRSPRRSSPTTSVASGSTCC